ncbi:probable LRR receptor-like serine/threonine-protein kinase At3g47570 [Punica granatum]|uniref:non-specific serine/threonine protein kinase n=1 Tax=Punica granatum TaxID=22663 RepID=A0A6P8DVQ0_PUNGR|nr:probable LRR receptor-like serine/threonine-protein kinase At3g47570 [Punica granatum]
MTPKMPNCSFILFLIIFQAVAASSLTNETDYEALIAFRGQITSDPSNALSSWNGSIHFCNWNGVTCGKKHQRVTALELPSLKLAGTLPPHIGNLTFLRMLNIFENGFSGILPEEIGRLTRLQTLSLDNNSFEGELPRNLTNCADLSHMGLGGNNFHGSIPEGLGSLIKLAVLWLYTNQFTGKIPPSLGNLSALTDLALAKNHIEGDIPPQLGQLSKLTHLRLQLNDLSGPIPPSLYNISSIVMFAVGGNNLSGSLPSDLFLTLPKLQGLYLGINMLSGPVPSSITNASELVVIVLSSNAFTGPMPTDLGGLKKLQSLFLGGNLLGTEQGDDLRFLTSLNNCTDLRAVWGNYNNLKGTIPDSVTNFSTTFTLLALHENFISGAIPSRIGNLVNLEWLTLYDNMLTGRIPDSIGELSKLQLFSIGLNNISGVIPSSIGNMTSIIYFFVLRNMLEGAIPSSIGNCAHLSEVDFSQNHLVGNVPEQLFGLSLVSIEAAQNNLTGPIPYRIGKLVNLQNLDLSENNMSGEIPSTIGDSVVLQWLYLQGNHFSGTIPPSMSNLKGIAFLDLSRNNFSGQIPGFFADRPFIQNLNLSFNMFEGEVPNRGVFQNLSVVSVTGNSKLCGGPLGLQLPKCIEAAPKKGHKSQSRMTALAIGISVSIFLLLTGVIISARFFYRSSRSVREETVTSLTEDRHLKLSYMELSQATDGFSLANKIGEGSFGVVYKGILPSSEQTVAVKVLKLQERGARKSFMAECEALRNIRHRNLVKTITCCSTLDSQGGDFMALVFEFMENGSLEKWLHAVPNEAGGSETDMTLGLLQRLNIAIDVGNALEYLHHHGQTPIVHCDLKPSNVLLDSEFTAYVSDFGLAKFLMGDQASGRTETSSIGIRGTIGYVAPEYGVGGEVSTKGDVYSFGILLLELFTGKRPTAMFSGDFGLHEFVERSLPHGLDQVLDPLLRLKDVQGNLHECLVSIQRVGLMCSAAQPNERMDISKAAVELQKARSILLRGKTGRESCVLDI